MPCCIKSILAAALLAGGLSACSPAPPPAGPRELALLYTCDTRGTIHACDCTGGSAGGLARRQTHLKTQPAANRLLVDAGNVGAGAGARDRLDLDFLLRGYRALGYDAINAGRGEAILGADDLRALGQQYPELISANLVDPSARPVLPAYRIRTLPNGLRVAQGKAEAVGSDITVLYDQVAEAPEMKGLLDEHAQAVAILTNQATRATSSGLEGLTTLPGAQP